MNHIGLTRHVTVLGRFTGPNSVPLLPSCLLCSFGSSLHAVGHEIVDDANEAASADDAANDECNVCTASSVVTSIAVAIAIASSRGAAS